MNQDVIQDEVKVPAFCRKDFTEDGLFTFTFGNGEVVTLDTNTLPEDQKFNLFMHGVGAKCGDSYAGAKGDFTVAIAAVQKVIDQLMADQWCASRASSGEGAPKIGELSQAIANLKSMDVAVVSAAVAKATDDQRKAWRKNAAIAAEIARMRAEKAAARAAKEDTGGTADDITL